MSETSLPSKDLIMEACAGNVAAPHLILQTACELARLHEARISDDPGLVREIDCERVRLVHVTDQYVAASMPIPHDAASLHTETVGMVVDRLAQYSVVAYAALIRSASDWDLHCAWQRLAELSVAYGDLAFDLATRKRRVPDFSPAGPGGTPDRGQR
ncbi:DUF4254 domain-containing protein [Nocardia sp. BMG51109]|uniref:DUF4254 domain-containing protein n=1 Tax=Nocardia sp. BMG51109 TaxID=1056816 RepID=UPI0004644460|nr:DUF4254 domain-containing protein [Nocardia sp. BMG51109]